MPLPGQPLGCPEGPQPLGNSSPLRRSVRYMGLIPAGRGPASSPPYRSRMASNTREARAVPGRSLLPPPGAGRSSHPARAGQPGSASARRCCPAAARSYGPPPGTAAPARCSPPLPLTLSAPPGCARIASTGSRGPQQRPTLPDLPQQLRTAPRPPPCGGPLCPTPAATAPGCRAARLGRSAPGCSPKVPGGLWGRAAARLSTRPGLSGARRPPGRLGLAYARRSGRRAWLGHAAALAQARRLGSCCPCVRLGGGPARSI